MPFLWIGLVAFGGAAALLGVLTVRRKRIRYPVPQSYIVEPPTDATVSRLGNGDVELRWSRDVPLTRIESHPPAHIEFQGGRIAHVSGLSGSERYFFTLYFEDGLRLRAAERFLPLQGGVNFRDVGGYRTQDGRYVRWGRLFRAGRLAGLTESDYTHLERLAVQLVCDLRSVEEIALEPDKLPESMKYLHTAIYTDSDSSRRLRALFFDPQQLGTLMLEAYTQQMVDRNAQAIGGVVQRLSDVENLPALIHCTAGKDRTGITIAVVLSILGVPDATITADYSLSNYYYTTFREIVRSAVGRLTWVGITVDDMQLLLTANPAMMQAVLDHIRQRYGSVEGYLRDAAGIDSDTIDRLKANLLEEG